jgi:hypothetical protein
MYLHVRARVSVRACLCARACVPAMRHFRARVRFTRARVCRTRVCVRRGCAGPLVARRGVAVFIARPAPVSRALAAGVMWTSRTASAPWAARHQHTSVVDAAGAIYVIGGQGIGYFQDVWVSTDGGARPDSAGVVGGY